PTPPVVSTITVPFYPRCATPLVSACGVASDAVDDCLLSYSAAGQASLKTSCYCQQSIIAEAFTCIYVGNVTCDNNGQVNTQSLWGYGSCSNFPSLFSSLVAQVSKLL